MKKVWLRYPLLCEKCHNTYWSYKEFPKSQICRKCRSFSDRFWPFWNRRKD